MYNFGSFDAFIVKPTILSEICSTIFTGIGTMICEEKMSAFSKNRG